MTERAGFRERLKQLLQRLTSAQMVGAGGLAVLSAASLFALVNEVCFETIGEVEQFAVIREHAVAANHGLEATQIASLGIVTIQAVGDVAVSLASLAFTDAVLHQS